MKSQTYDRLRVSITDTNELVGEAVAEEFARAVRAELKHREVVSVILATGNSQLSFARAVVNRDDIEWSRVRIVNMDEYYRMPEDHSASFRRWLRENIVDHVSPRGYEMLQGEYDPVEDELERYRKLLRDLDPAITVMGIGENGHLAFNDPPADFHVKERVRLVELDERSRRQQVEEGHFTSLEEAPAQALSLTIPSLLQARTVLVGVPEERKAQAVKSTLKGPISPDCPASILREQPQAQLFLDKGSASLLE